MAIGMAITSVISPASRPNNWAATVGAIAMASITSISAHGIVGLSIRIQCQAPTETSAATASHGRSEVSRSGMDNRPQVAGRQRLAKIVSRPHADERDS